MNEYSVYIQHDWDECIKTIGSKVWISLKKRNEPSIHGHLLCKSLKFNGLPVLEGSNGFEVEMVSSHSIQVKHSSCASVKLLYSYRVINDVHNSSVTSLDVVNDRIVSASESVLKSFSILGNEASEHKIMTGHSGDIYCCRWFPNLEAVLSCGADLRIKIWYVHTGECVRTFVGHTKAVTDLAIIDRGRNFISVSKDGTAKLWNVGNGQLIDDLIKSDLSTYINCCSLSALKNVNLNKSMLQSISRDTPAPDTEVGTEDKCLLIGCENGLIALIGVYAQKIIVSKKIVSAVNACYLNNDAQVFIGCNDGQVMWLNEQLETLHCVFDTNSPVRCLCFFKGRVVSGHADGSCVVRSTNGSKTYLTGTNAESINKVCTNERFLFTACRNGIIREYLPELLPN